MKIPNDILGQHIAVLGKTGSGKTSTAKLAIEQVVAGGARVCVLDPIKSDWWGLTSSANGKHAGLPFHILGGPHGHVPVHASAGKAIAEIVASGALPLSIIDMAEFEPGGQAKFFVDFAPALLRKMRGVVYLVIEEAHLFAPKERSGIGAENLSIHWAKTLATAGRSKGVRLVLVTQRTQALHNALLGSCDTLIAHRLTAPADQEPVVKWLKANAPKGTLDQVAGSIASLKTGQGWICSGEARRFELVSFPRITTYDNTATPTGDAVEREVKTAPVDQEKLRAIIGGAVDEAKANDPKELKKQLAAVRQELAQKERVLAEVDARTKRIDDKLQKVAGKSPSKASQEQAAKLSELRNALTAHRRALEAAMKILVKVKAIDFPVETDEDLKALEQALAAAVRQVTAPIEKRVTGLAAKVEGFKRDAATAEAAITALLEEKIELQVQVEKREPFQVEPVRTTSNRLTLTPRPGATSDNGLAPGERRILTAVAQFGEVDRGQLTVLVGYKATARDTYISRLAQKGLVESGQGRVRVTQAGVDALGADYEPLPTGPALLAYWRGRLAPGECKVLDAVVSVYPENATRGDIGESTGYKPTARDTYISRLASRRLVQSDGRGSVRASAELFG